jgi:hypothetical protein
MRTVWKFPLVMTDYQSINMPHGAEILTVEMQGDQPCLWALCEPENALRPRSIWIHGTGHRVGDIARYIGSVQMMGGALVFHVFEGQT